MIVKNTVWIKCARLSESGTSFPQLFSHLRETSSRKRKLIKVHSKRCWRKSSERTTRATIMYTAFSNIFFSPSALPSPCPPLESFAVTGRYILKSILSYGIKYRLRRFRRKYGPRPCAARGYHAWVCAFTKYLSTAAALINWLVN